MEMNHGDLGSRQRGYHRTLAHLRPISLLFFLPGGQPCHKSLLRVSATVPGSGLSKGMGDEDSSTSKVKIRTKRETDTNNWKRDGMTLMMNFRLGT